MIDHFLLYLQFQFDLLIFTAIAKQININYFLNNTFVINKTYDVQTF